MPDYKFTPYCERRIVNDRPYIKKEWCIRVIENPIRQMQQEDGRFRFWGKIEEMEDRFLRVVTFSDKITIHNAFLDRRFKP